MRKQEDEREGHREVFFFFPAKQENLIKNFLFVFRFFFSSEKKKLSLLSCLRLRFHLRIVCFFEEKEGKRRGGWGKRLDARLHRRRSG